MMNKRMCDKFPYFIWLRYSQLSNVKYEFLNNSPLNLGNDNDDDNSNNKNKKTFA